MTENIRFDTELAERLDVLYASADVLRRRRLARRALGPVPGDRILDVGCGTGYYADEVAVQVGPAGRVIGIDSSPAMLAIAADRTARHDNVTLLEGTATALPVDDGWADRTLAVQVLGYVHDVDAAIAELARTVRPGGTIVVWDIDWATLSWHSDDPDLTDRILDVWRGHLAHPSLPRTLAPTLSRAGFEEVRPEGYAFVNRDAGPNSYSGMLIPLITDYVRGRSDITDAEVAAWQKGQEELSAAGEYFCSVIQFCFTAVRS